MTSATNDAASVARLEPTIDILESSAEDNLVDSSRVTLAMALPSNAPIPLAGPDLPATIFEIDNQLQVTERESVGNILNSKVELESSVEKTEISTTTSPSDDETHVVVPETAENPALGTSIALETSCLDSKDTDVTVSLPTVKPSYVMICSSDFIAIVRATSDAPIVNQMSASAVTLDSSSDVQQLDSFELFPKLPLELRRLVWGNALPEGRNADFSSLKTWEDSAFASIERLKDHRNSDTHLPIALIISKESRAETLRYYFVHPASLQSQPGVKLAPYIFAPKRDSAIMSFSHALSSIKDNNLEEFCWLYQMPSDQVASCLSQVKQLCITLKGAWGPDSADAFKNFSLPKQDESEIKEEDHWCSMLHKFSALKKVTFSIYFGEDNCLIDIRARTKFLRFMENVLGTNVSCFSSGKAPEIVLECLTFNGDYHYETAVEHSFIEQVKGEEDDSDDSDEESDIIGLDGNIVWLAGGDDTDEESDEEVWNPY